MAYFAALDIMDSYLDEPALTREQIKANRLIEKQGEIEQELKDLMRKVNRLEEKRTEIICELDGLGYSA